MWHDENMQMYTLWRWPWSPADCRLSSLVTTSPGAGVSKRRPQGP